MKKFPTMVADMQHVIFFEPKHNLSCHWKNCRIIFSILEISFVFYFVSVMLMMASTFISFRIHLRFYYILEKLATTQIN